MFVFMMLKSFNTLIMDSNERIKRVVDYLKTNKLIRNQQHFVELVGSDRSTISQILNNKIAVPNNLFGKIVEAFPSVNEFWLLTGEGEMLKIGKPTEGLSSLNLLDPNRPQKVKMVPLLSLDALGGFSSNVEQGEEYTQRLIPWTNALDGDFAVEVSGSSMMPIIMPGSYLLLRRVECWREFLEYNILYVLELIDLRRLVKLVQRAEDRDYVTLVSYNPATPPQDLPLSLIRQVFKVVGIHTQLGF